ncbi:MAG: hypothetical protein JWO08_3368 [Verrucomicrobiaceae bacterium]|nr:hypothetical protein [Verrucomicrobiaceae bacterium]
MQIIAPNHEPCVENVHRYTPKAVLDSSEARFHTCLISLCKDRCHVLCKPQLTDVFDHHDGIGFNKISQKHIDFLVCRQHDWLPMLGIELDDNSTARDNVRCRDTYVNELFACTGIPLIRIHVNEVEEIEVLVEKLTLAWRRRAVSLRS